MANRYANNDALRNLKRMNGDLSISKEQKDRLFNIATAHLAAGNVGDFVTAISVVTKADTMNDIQERLDKQEKNQQRMMEALQDNKAKDDDLVHNITIQELCGVIKGIDDRLKASEEQLKGS